MMHINSGKFDNPKSHHPNWFAFYRGRGIAEVWFGKKYWTIDWKD